MDGKILVTGGAGFIGSHVVVALAQAGYAPFVVDSFVNSSRSVLPRLAELCGRPVEVVEADVRDAAALRRIFHDHAIAGVVHCAGLKAVGEGEERPLAYWDVNVGGTIALAEVMGEAGVARLVFSSSATVYGQPDVLPVAEDAQGKNILEGTVAGRVFLGPIQRVALDTGEERILVDLLNTEKGHLSPGDRLRVSFSPGDGRLIRRG